MPVSLLRRRALATAFALALMTPTAHAVSVEASAVGTVIVLERASDGARAGVRVSGQAAQGASTVVGSGVTVSAVATGWILSTASEVIALVPNEIGAALLYNERVTR